MFAKANNGQKFIFIDGIATKYYIIGHLWFISEYYCSKSHNCYSLAVSSVSQSSFKFFI